MLIDCARGAPPARIEADVAIIGSGAAGLALALTLEARGLTVALLEAGPAGFTKAAQDFYRAATIEPGHGPTHLYRRRAFGGTTAVWGGRCIPFDPIDFEERSWIPHSGWPIGYDELAAYYPQALALCKAGAPVFDAADALPGEHGSMVDGVASPDLILDRIERFSEPTHFGRAYRRQLEGSARATVLIGAAVTEIVAEDGGAVCRRVKAVTDGGATIEVAAPRTVVAAGGLETPRLLLASRSARGCGLGNERDLVGRFYQGHVEGEVGEIHFARPAADVHLDYERAADGTYCRRYIWLSPDAQRRERTGNLIARPAHASIVDPEHGSPVLSAMYLVKDMIVPEYSRKLTANERRVKAEYGAAGKRLFAAHVGNIVRHPLALGGFSVDWIRRRILATRKLPSVVLRDPRNSYPLDINAEQSPDPDNRVWLSDELDAHGVPRLSVRCTIGAEDRAAVGRGMRAMQAAFAQSGAATISLDALDEQLGAVNLVGGHHIGTARMGGTAATGVVDRNGAVWGTAGLFVAGAATFPTSSFANPTLTLVAMTLRLADHLATAAGRPPAEARRKAEAVR